VVQPEDNLADLADRYGVSQSDLVAINNLNPPYTLKPGQTLNIPSQSESSNLPAMTASAVPPPTPMGTVSATPLPPPGAPTTTTMPKATTPSTGGTISSTALPPPTPLPAPTATPPKPAATTPLPSTTKTPPVTATPTAPVEVETETAPPATQTATAPTAKKTPEQIEAETEAAVEAAAEAAEAAKASGPAAGTGKGPFVWPVQGKVIGAFGSSKDGMKNDGINIAAPSGAPVVASADGTVAYAGNELRGFGYMILIRHDGGYVTAYAHNASLLVKKGDKVKRGQTIARVGQTGAVFGPQLHFEIRKGTQPVDPMSFLGG
jgi:murein DD-endopeptidase MepM/ murein hydrolase activator NlpD